MERFIRIYCRTYLISVSAPWKPRNGIVIMFSSYIKTKSSEVNDDQEIINWHFKTYYAVVSVTNQCNSQRAILLWTLLWNSHQPYSLWLFDHTDMHTNPFFKMEVIKKRLIHHHLTRIYQIKKTKVISVVNCITVAISVIICHLLLFSFFVDVLNCQFFFLQL